MFSNPAGMTRLGKRLDADLEFFNPDRQYKANADFAPPPPVQVSRRAGTKAITTSF
jgi:hypothetical protein